MAGDNNVPIPFSPLLGNHNWCYMLHLDIWAKQNQQPSTKDKQVEERIKYGDSTLYFVQNLGKKYKC